MKVVLFCGGEGMRLRDHSGPIPKPMVEVGNRPIIWHVMKYYAHFGHKDFILCLGHGASYVKRYFVEYDETVSNDFVLEGGTDVQLLRSDLHDWRITFVDTGLDACVGERLMAVRPLLAGDEWFLANYTDGVSDAPLDEVIAFARSRGAAATFIAVQPNYTSHVIQRAPDGWVTGVQHVSETGISINGGFWVMNQRYFDFARPGEDIMDAPAQRMVAAGQLAAYPHHGFWACMDTFKEKRLLDDIHASGVAPWHVWERPPEPPLDAGDGRTGSLADAPAASAPR